MQETGRLAPALPACARSSSRPVKTWRSHARCGICSADHGPAAEGYRSGKPPHITASDLAVLDGGQLGTIALQLNRSGFTGGSVLLTTQMLCRGDLDAKPNELSPVHSRPPRGDARCAQTERG